ncbi:aminoglycoside phosphotransferase family protein [Bacillus sp. BP-3]|uniref:aminoglycoside phosphotransferase family protein n=1 Tax=Bacillus sp. BP-3 TaxID=3022773 RepID=UPI00232C482B|nr:aminoglycoside phosphotransferase family protein [Bacillus sp. BP-3]MDC2864458.1 aminoglycoside phosphotransferase family protein [Bacillus sp. BP-3]
MLCIPSSFKTTIQDVHGEQGKQWIEKLPSTIQEIEEKLSLQVIQSCSNLSYNYVSIARKENGQDVVLKLGVPSDDLKNEIEALRYFQGEGTVALLDSDSDYGYLLLEYIKPGMSLAYIENEEKATTIIGQTMKKLWKPVPTLYTFPSIEQWSKGLQRLRVHFDGDTGPLPKDLVNKAEDLFPQLIKTISKPLLLYGDLHHDNALCMGTDQWLAIDPKGVIGEAEYETIAYLRNHLFNKSNPKKVLANRIQQLAEELQLDKERMIAWGLSHCILSSWWYFESHDRVPEETIACARWFDELRVSLK